MNFIESGADLQLLNGLVKEYSDELNGGVDAVDSMVTSLLEYADKHGITMFDVYKQCKVIAELSLTIIECGFDVEGFVNGFNLDDEYKDLSEEGSKEWADAGILSVVLETADRDMFDNILGHATNEEFINRYDIIHRNGSIALVRELA